MKTLLATLLILAIPAFAIDPSQPVSLTQDGQWVRDYPRLPASWRGISPYAAKPESVWLADGFRQRIPATAPEGHVLGSVTNRVVTDTECIEQAETISDADIYAARVAEITPELWQTAGLFRTILHIHFGEGAETDTELTEAAITGYFVQRRLGGTSESTDASDAILLTKGFDAIKAWTQTDNIWSFPWDMIE